MPCGPKSSLTPSSLRSPKIKESPTPTDAHALAIVCISSYYFLMWVKTKNIINLIPTIIFIMLSSSVFIIPSSDILTSFFVRGSSLTALVVGSGNSLVSAGELSNFSGKGSLGKIGTKINSSPRS